VQTQLWTDWGKFRPPGVWTALGRISVIISLGKRKRTQPKETSVAFREKREDCRERDVGEDRPLRKKEGGVANDLETQQDG